jgi:gliding motility-associated-like protein
VSGNHGASDFWVFKLNAAGTIQWQKCYGGEKNETAYFVTPTPDGGYVLAGEAESSDGDVACNAGNVDEWIVKIDALGNLQWQKSLGGNDHDEASCVRPLSDGSYIVAGTTCSPDIQGYHSLTGTNLCGDFWLVKLAAPALIYHRPIIMIDPALAFICAGNTATITTSAVFVGASPTYQWKRNGIIVGTNSASYTASDFANNDAITCTVTNGGECGITSDQASVTVVVQLKTGTINPQISISASQTILCACDEIMFRASVTGIGTSPVYQWNVNGVKTGNGMNTFASSLLNDGDVVTCNYMDNTDCMVNESVVSNPIKVTSTQGKAPSVSIVASRDTACAGSLVRFEATSLNAGANPSYQWKVNGTNVGANSNIFTTSSLLNGDIISCVMNTDSLFVCALSPSTTSNSIVMTISNSALPSVSIISSNNDVCSGVPLTFNATAQNAGASPIYQWILNNTNVGNNSPIYTNNGLSNGDQVTCVITPGNTSCTNSLVTSNVITVAIDSVPVITIVPSDTIINAGSQIQLNASISGNVSSFQWSPAASLENPLSLKPTTTELSTTTAYSLIASSDKGCTASQIAVIKVFVLLYMPSAFTPNRDGKNDIYRIPPNVSLTLENFSVYDRWGMRVFSTKNISEGWDGTIHGHQASTGVYVYMVEGTNQKGTVFLKGSFVLIR